MPGTDPIRDELPLLIADLYEVAGAMRRNGDRLAAVAGQTQARWQVLSVVREGDWTAPRIARRLGITRQAVQRVLDQLAADGLVVAEPNPEHERSSLIRLTHEGRAVLEAITAQARGYHEQLARVLGLEDLQAARRVLRALIEVEVDERPGPGSAGG
jgi:DNA-binding MarR family transcriptional regulator